MDPELNASPAGGGDQTPEVKELSLSAAADRIEKLDNNEPASKPEKAPESASADTDEDDFTKADDEGSTDDGSPESESSEDDEEDDDWGRKPKAEDEQTQDEFVKGDAKVRLKDGKVVPVSELKKLVDLVPEFQRQREQLGHVVEAARREVLTQVANERAQLAEQAKAMNQIIPLAITKLRMDIPDPVPDEVWQNDELTAIRMERARNQKIAQLEQLENAYADYQNQEQQRQTEAQAEQEQVRLLQRNERVKTEFQTLVQKLPALANPERAKKFAARVTEGAKAYGFSEAEVKGIHDHRMMVALADLARLNRLMTQGNAPAAKPAATRTAPQAPPVRTPGRRTSDAETRGVHRQSLVERAKKTGSINDVARAIEAL